MPLTRDRGARVLTRPDLRRPLALLAALLIAAVALVGLEARPAKAAADDTIRIALTDDVDTFNPFLAVLLSSTGINRYQYENLVGYDQKSSEPTEGIASKWSTNDDGTVWTFTIPKDRVWSDGEPITADDVVYTYTSIMKNRTLQTANGGLVTNFEKVEATDPQTVRLTLKEAQASNPGVEIPIVPEHVWSKQDPTKFEADSDVVGSGPFLITSYKTGQSIRLKANKRFWRGAPKIDGITYTRYKSVDAAVQGLKAGDVDLLSGLTPAQFESLDGADGITTNAGKGRRYQAIAINPGAVDNTGKKLGDGNPALQDPKVREAIFMAIDKKTLVKRVLQGYGRVGETEVPTVYPRFYGFAEGHEAVPFDLDAANDLLEQAGWVKGADGVRAKNGKKLELRLMGRNSDVAHSQMADFVQSWLKDVGIKLKVSMVSPDQVNEDSTLGRYDLYFTGWSIGPDPDFQLSMNRCASRPNADGSGPTSENNWCSPAFDKLYDEQHAELDADARAEVVKQAFTAIYDAHVSNPIYYADQLEAYNSDRFADFGLQPAKGGQILNQNGYWGLYEAAPADEASGSGGTPGWLLPAGAVVLLALLAGGVLVARRRGASSDDRE